MSDFWNDAAESDVAEPAKASYAGIPDGVSVIVRTTNRSDKETVHPQIKEFKRKSDESKFYIAKLPLIVVGGDAKLDPKFIGRYLFLDLNVEKPSVTQLESWIANAKTDAQANRLKGQLSAHSKYPCGPELYNFMLDALAPEEGTAPERWAKVRAFLAEKGKECGLTPELCANNTQYMYAEAFKQVLLERSLTLIGKTYTPKQKEGSQYAPQQTVGSIGADTPENRTKRKVKLIDPPAKDDGGGF